MEAQPLKAVLANLFRRLGINMPDLDTITSDCTELPCWGCGRMIEATRTEGGYFKIPECVDCRRARFREMLDSESGLDRRHTQFTLSRFEAFEHKTESQVKALEAIKNYDLAHPRSLYLHGPVGSGKTHLACGLCHRRLDSFQRVLFRTGIQILYQIRETFSDDSRTSTRAIIEWFSEAPFLVVDDLGGEKMTEWVRETFYAIVDGRNMKMLPTIVTTNYSPSELAKRLDGEDQPDRIVSRLIQDAILIRIDGPDGRLIESRREE